MTAGNNTVIENLAFFVEKYCAPLAKELPSCIKDNAHLLDILDQINTSELEIGTMLISFDVVDMFPSIENEQGVIEVRNKLDKRDVFSPSNDCLIEALEICLFLNNSTFAGQNLLQENGTAMGTANSCSYLNLAVAALVSKIGNFTELKYYGRYRDDCLTIWNGMVRLFDLFLFINNLNNLQFTMKIGDYVFPNPQAFHNLINMPDFDAANELKGNALCFLDVDIKIQGMKLVTSVYSKPTDSHLYLHGKSHVTPKVQSIV